MNTLKIEIPEGFEVDNFDKKTGEVKFKPVPKDIKEILNNFTDVLNWHGITQNQFDKNNKGLTPDEIGYRKEKLIVAAYNEGKLPDWTDGTPKYWPWFKMGSPSGLGFSYFDFGSWGSGSGVGSRLCFCGENAKANMLDAVNKFINEYEESRTK